jgi:hypothetical protein
MLLAVNKTRMRQGLDRLKKTLGRQDEASHSFKLWETEEPPHKGASPAQKPGGTPIPAAVPPGSNAPMNLKLR